MAPHKLVESGLYGQNGLRNGADTEWSIHRMEATARKRPHPLAPLCGKGFSPLSKK